MKGRNITLILGSAGSGKTEHVANIISTIDSEFVCLSPTHASLKNIRDRTTRMNPNIEPYLFKTLHAFFHIDYVNDHVCGPDIIPPTIFIDELFMFDYALLKRCLRFVPKNVKLVLSGDPLQLPSIQTNKQRISLEKLNRLLDYDPDLFVVPYVLQHLNDSLISSKWLHDMKILHLKYNRRSNVGLVDMVNRFIANGDNRFPVICEIQSIVRYLASSSSVCLSSRYEFLQRVWDNMPHDDEETIIHNNPGNDHNGFKTLYLKRGQRYECIHSTDVAANGEMLIYNRQLDAYTLVFDAADADADAADADAARTSRQIVMRADKTKKPFFPLSHPQLCTIHRSQGREWKNVCVMMNDLFLSTMLYVALTRARDDVLLYSPDRKIVYNHQQFKNIRDGINILSATK
jgi:hypothetical protein